MSIREQGVVVQHSPLGHVAPFMVGDTPVGLPDLPPLDRIRRVLIYVTEDVLWSDEESADPAVAGMLLPSDSFLVYDATGTENFKMVRAGASDAQVRVCYHGL